MFSKTPQAENYQPGSHANSDTNHDTSATRPTYLLPNENVVNDTILNNSTGVTNRAEKNRCTLVPCTYHAPKIELRTTKQCVPKKFISSYLYLRYKFRSLTVTDQK